MDLITNLKTLLASSFVLYLKSHRYHWNVTGPNFAEYHEFFGDFYEEIFSSIDTTAEEIRKMGSLSIGSLESFSQFSTIVDDGSSPTAMQMFYQLNIDNSEVLRILYLTRDLADTKNKFGLVNYLEDRISTHEKHQWMLKSHYMAQSAFVHSSSSRVE